MVEFTVLMPLLRLLGSLPRQHLLHWRNLYNLNGLMNRRWLAIVGICCSSSMMSLFPALFDSDVSELETSMFFSTS